MHYLFLRLFSLHISLNEIPYFLKKISFIHLFSVINSGTLYLKKNKKNREKKSEKKNVGNERDVRGN